MHKNVILHFEMIEIKACRPWRNHQDAKHGYVGRMYGFLLFCVCVLVRFSDDHEFTLICVIIDFIRLSTTCNKNKYSLIMLGLSNMFNFLARFLMWWNIHLLTQCEEMRVCKIKNLNHITWYVGIERSWYMATVKQVDDDGITWLKLLTSTKWKYFFFAWKCSSLQENWNESQIALKEGDYVTAKMRLR